MQDNTIIRDRDLNFLQFHQSFVEVDARKKEALIIMDQFLNLGRVHAPLAN